MVEHAASRVVMRRYGEEEIEATIARGDPFDKAGAYAIQDPVFRPVERWDGCYCNVVGLPLWTALALLRRAGTDAGSADGRMPRECASCPGRPLS
jgi:predicted house-cleaning NTP pyrophosphatase (Maf/HAM1 superfamily)